MDDTSLGVMTGPRLAEINRRIVVAIGQDADTYDGWRESWRLVGPYGVFFDGFIASPVSAELIANIKGWPVQKDGDYGSNGSQYFVHTIRGQASGIYQAGTSWNIRALKGVSHFTINDLDTPEGEAQAIIEVRGAIDHVATMIGDYLSGRPVPRLPMCDYVAFDPESGEILSQDHPQPTNEQTIYREEPAGSGRWRIVKQQRRWVDVELGKILPPIVVSM